MKCLLLLLLQSAPQQKQDVGCSTTDGLETKECEKQSADCCEKKKKRKHKEKADMPEEQNQDGALEWTGDAGTKNHSKDSGPHLNPPTPKHKKKKKNRTEDQRDSSERTTQNDSDEEESSGIPVSLPKHKHKHRHKHKHKDMEEDDVDTKGEGVLQQASGTKVKQHGGAEVHKLPWMNGVEGDHEMVVLAVGEHSSRKRKHKAMKVAGRDSAPLCIEPDKDCGDPTQSAAKRLKIDSSGLGFVKAKKSKHKHGHKL